MTNEEILTSFMQQNYSDERLAWLLAHAKEGRLSYHSCCCFIGIVTADHALRGSLIGSDQALAQHLPTARLLQDGHLAEQAFRRLCGPDRSFHWRRADEERRANLIPLVEAEIARREALKQQENTPKDALVEVLA